MFRVRPFEAKTLSWWAAQRHLIDFEPPYQRRGSLWSRSDKQFLIDSILNDYDVPKIYVADFTYAPSVLNERSTHYAVIDGKQRFEAILDFFDGKFVLRDDFVWSKDPSVRLAGMGYKDLKVRHPSVAMDFENFNLTVMSVVTDEEAKINELFVRLNRNKTLTGSEIRNAMPGVVPKLIRELAKDQFFTDRVRFDTARGQDLDAAGKMLLVEFRGRLVETKKNTLDKFVTEGNNDEVAKAEPTETDFDRAAKRVRRVLVKMNKTFLTRDPLLANQGVIVPYYWLARETDDGEVGAIRPFLTEFTQRLAANKKITDDPASPLQADPKLSRYIQLNRSINDAQSLEGRYGILDEEFEDWIEIAYAEADEGSTET